MWVGEYYSSMVGMGTECQQWHVLLCNDSVYDMW